MKKIILAALLGVTVSLISGCGNYDVNNQMIVENENVEGNVDNTNSDENEQKDKTETELNDSEIVIEGLDLSTDEENMNIKEGKFGNISFILDNLNNENKNTILSDTSLNIAFGLIGQGAKKDANKSISEYLGTDLDTYAEYVKDMMSEYNSSDSDANLYIANNVWGNKEVKFNEEYINKVNENFGVVPENLDFSDSESADIINSWVSNKTNGCIPDIIKADDLINQDIVLINSLYFKSDWNKPFEEGDIAEEDFTNADKSVTKVDMMNGKGDSYYENDNAIAFSKLYKKGYEFIGILPKNEGEYSLSEIDIDSLIESETSEYTVNIKLPKFKVEDSNEILSVLKETKLNEALSPSADYSGISDSAFSVSKVFQKTYVDVNEKGTEAAAVSGLSMLGTSMQVENKVKEVYLDRPFTFIIYDVTNNECLFIGKINKL